MRGLLLLLLLSSAGWSRDSWLTSLHPTSLPHAQGSITITALEDSSFLDAYVGWVVGTACRSQQGMLRCPIGLRQTQDGGKTWIALPAPQLDVAQARHIHFASRQVGWLYGTGLSVTRDGGQTWTTTSRHISALVSVGSSIWAIEQRPGHIPRPVTGALELENMHSVLIHSPDYGATWNDLPHQPSEISAFSQLVRTSAHQAWMLTPTEVGPVIHTTADGGQQWRQIPNFMNGMSCGLAATDVRGRDHLWLMCSGPAGTGHQSKRLYTSPDEGRYWTIPADAMFFQPTIGSLPSYGYFQDPAQFTAVSDQRAFLGLGRSTLYRTDDGGQTWTEAIPFGQADPDSNGGFQAVRFVETDIGWAIMSKAVLFRTMNGGTTWQRIQMR